jgi:hypothetical protein
MFPIPIENPDRFFALRLVTCQLVFRITPAWVCPSDPPPAVDPSSLPAFILQASALSTCRPDL